MLNYSIKKYFRRICELFFPMVVTFFFFKIYIFNKRKLHISIYRRKSQSCWNFWKKKKWFLGRENGSKFFYPSGGNRKGSVCLACCGEKCITSPRATYTCHLVSAWLSLQMYSSKQEESLKKSHETYKVNKMAYDLFFVQYFMTYKKTQSTVVFRLVFHLKDRSFNSVRFITSGKWEKCKAVEVFFQLRLFSAVWFVPFIFEPLIPIPGKESWISLKHKNREYTHLRFLSNPDVKIKQNKPWKFQVFNVNN